MIVTISTDASFSWTMEKGSFAFWIVSNEGKIAKSGMLKKRIHRAEQAEFQCILNAVHVLIAADWKNVEKIIINTDCLNVIHLINNNKRAIQKYRLRSWGAHLVLLFNLMLMQSKMRKAKIEFRHIKAHEGTETPKQWVNDWCDKEAKKQIMNHVLKQKLK